MASRGLAVQARLATSAPVDGDENQLRQAFLNLLRNAAEAMPEGGTLEVELLRQAGQARVRIRDTGTGIAADNLPRIFDPFFSTKHGGTGLGLALTQQIIGEHGGRIEVDSELGAGTTFTVWLPLLAEASGAE
jgi:signal transduction histidine kinase